MYSVDEIIDLEKEAGQVLGPFQKQWYKDKGLTLPGRLSSKFIDFMPNQSFNGVNMGLGAVATSAFGASTSSAVEQNILTQAGAQGIINQFNQIPAMDAFAGKVYEVKYGGVYSTSSAAPTLIVTPRWGSNSTPGTNVTLGASPTTTLIASATTLPYYGQFTFTVMLSPPGATTGTGRGMGFQVMQIPVTSSQIAMTIPFGGTLASIDTTGTATAGCGLSINWTYSAGNASNVQTAQWWVLQSLT